MKLSLKFQDEPSHEDQQKQIMTAKVPLTIFNYPFISGVTATTSHLASYFSFSISTNFSSGPSFKLSYSPTSFSSISSPFSLSLKSGLGMFGSPQNSPLVFSANLSLSPSNTIVPAFFLHLKPQFGHFSLNKTVFSDQISGSPTNGRVHSDIGSDNNSEIGDGFVAGVSSSAWQELKLEPFGSKDEVTNLKHKNNCEVPSNGGNGIGFAPERSPVLKNSGIYGLSSGAAIMARTVMPVTKGLSLNLRWSLNFPGNMRLKMPYLTVNKIGLERVEEVKKTKQSKDTSDNDLQLLKSVYLWMQRDLENVEKENREMKQMLNEMKMEASTRNHRESYNGNGKKLSQSLHSSERSFESERWRSKKSGREENMEGVPNKSSSSLASDMESELQKAIKAASSLN